MFFSPSAKGVEAGSRRSRILLVEDHPLIQDAVANILRGRCDIAGIIDRVNDVLGAVQNLHPDAVILDISLPDISGMQVLPRLRSAFPGVGIVIFTTHVQAVYREEALARGANEFVSKFEASMELVPAIERALKAVRVSNVRRARSIKAGMRDFS